MQLRPTRKASPPRDDSCRSYLFTGYNLIRIGGFVLGRGATARHANAITSSRVCCVIRLVGYVFGRGSQHTHTQTEEDLPSSFPRFRTSFFSSPPPLPTTSQPSNSIREFTKKSKNFLVTGN